MSTKQQQKDKQATVARVDLATVFPRSLISKSSHALKKMETSSQPQWGRGGGRV